MPFPRTRKLALGAGSLVLLILGAIQFMGPERTNPPVTSEIQAPPEIAAILERSCYDCHSHETTWPWYAYVMPVSAWVVEHVEHAREEMNFSDWPVLDFEELEHYFEEIDEEVSEGEMPLKNYLWLHGDARLSEEEKATLLAWARSGGMASKPSE